MKRAQLLAAAIGFVFCAASAHGAEAAATSPDGATLFRQRCGTCHAVGRPSTLGPDLVGVVGRKAASKDFKYSPALQKSGLTWTKANLDKFLAAPTRVVPGTRMVIALPDAAQRAAVIDYLAKLR